MFDVFLQRIGELLEQVGWPTLVIAFKITVTILGGYTLIRSIDFALTRFKDFVDDKNPEIFSPAEQRAQVLSVLLGFGSRAVIWSVGTLMVLSYLDLNITPILTGAGIFGVVIGVGAQSLVRDLIVGFFVLYENQYGLGDIVKIDALSGTVEKMDLRTTSLRDINGNLHIISNGSISRVTVLTRTWSRALVDVPVSYQDDLERVQALLVTIGESLYNEASWQKLLLEEVRVLGVEDFTKDGVMIRVMVKTLPGKQWDVMRELRRRIRDEFTKAGIYIPFPQYMLPPNAAQSKETEGRT